MAAMPRQPRVEFPGAIYHLTSRGDRREDIFLNDVDRHDFLKTLAEACQKTGWQALGEDLHVHRAIGQANRTREGITIFKVRDVPEWFQPRAEEFTA